MKTTSSRPTLRLRSSVSLLTLFFFVALVVTGLVLYVEPHGRIAFWTHWRFLGLGKSQWDGIHVVTGIAFIVTGVLHLVLNIKPVLRYLGKRNQARFLPTRELLVTLALFVAVVVSAGAAFQPVQGLLDLNEHIKSSWVERPSDAPPFGHAEMHSLRSLCQKEGLDLQRAIGDIRAAGFALENENQTVAELATANATSPARIYGAIEQAREKAARKRMMRQRRRSGETRPGA